MKKVLFYVAVVAVPAFAQTPSLQWEKNVNGQLSGYENVQSSWKDPNGNFLITGTSNQDAFVLKIDNNGNQLLKIIWDGPQSGYDNGYAVRSDAAGNIYLGGLTSYNSKNVPFVVKYNAGGTKLWEYVQTTVSMNGVLTSIALDNYNSPVNLYFTGSKNDSSAVIKINATTGISSWEKTLWPHGKMNDIDIDNNGHPLVCGYQAFAGVNADFYAAVLDINNGFPLRGVWLDGGATDSITDPNGHFDMASKIKAGPSGTFVVLGTLYNTSNAASIYMAKFGSVGNTPTWYYMYDSPNHTEGNGIQLLSDVSFTSFYYLARAMSTSGTYYGYTIAGKVNNSGIGVWEKEFNQSGTSLEPHDMALDANGNAHIISDAGYPGDIYYKKLASATGNAGSALQYDNQRGGGNAYDYSSNIFLDNTSHPYIIGYSNALTYTNLDILVCRLNTNATLDWDITYDFFANAQDFVFNVQAVPTTLGTDQIVTCGRVQNNITNTDVSITSYDEKGNINWQEAFDDNNGYDQVIGFEKSRLNNLFLCSFNNSNNKTSVTEFYSNGTTNFSNQPNWTFQPTCFKIDSAENGFAAGSIYNASDFVLGIYLRSGSPLSNVPTVATSVGTNATGIATDNKNIYVAGTISDNSGTGINGQHAYIQKFDLAGNVLWSVKIMGFDSTSYTGTIQKIVYDHASGAVYVLGTNVSVGSSVIQTMLAKINQNGSVSWVKKENVSNTRYQFMNDMVVANGKIYIAGYAYNVSTPTDNLLLVEQWDINGNKQWEYIFDKANTDEEGQSLALDNTGNIFVGGKTNGTPSSASTSDMLLIKLNPSGNLVWKQEYNGVGNGADQCANIALSNSFASNPRIYMCGNTQSTQGYYYDIGTLKYCDLPVTTVSHSGSTSICQNSTIYLNTLGVIGGGNVLWSPGGQTFSTIGVNTTGNYYFTYSEMDGCAENSDTVTINSKAAPAPVQICMVTVDDSSKHNIIMWDKTSATPDVIGFNIYREDLTNIYHMIGSVPYANLSKYVDLDGNANPNTTTKRYKLTTVDSCGNESQMSNYHNTIYIVSSGGGQFSWNQLYTIENSPNPVAQYMLLRDDYNTNTWHVVDSTAGTQFNINDVNFSTFQPTANWRVATKWSISCTPTARNGNGNSVQSAIVKSKSNISNNRVAGINSVSGSMQVTAYPNPAQNTLTVNVPSSAKTIIKLRNLMGEEVVITELFNESTAQLDISKLASGVYMLEVNNNSGKFVKRIVKE